MRLPEGLGRSYAAQIARDAGEEVELNYEESSQVAGSQSSVRFHDDEDEKPEAFEEEKMEEDPNSDGGFQEALQV